MKVEVIDNSQIVLDKFTAAIMRAMEMCGLSGENFAKALCPVDTGNLRNSITHTVKVGDGTGEAIIGTNSQYAPYVEFGTGIYYPGGRRGPWVYQDAKGNWHMTNGQRAQPYLKPAVADHVDTYRGIIESELKNA